MNALKNHCVKQAYYSSCFKACDVQSFQVCKGPDLYPPKNEEIYDIVSYQKFSCHVTTCIGCIRIVQWVKWVNRSDPLSGSQDIIETCSGIIENLMCTLFAHIPPS